MGNILFTDDGSFVYIKATNAGELKNSLELALYSNHPSQPRTVHFRAILQLEKEISYNDQDIIWFSNNEKEQILMSMREAFLKLNSENVIPLPEIFNINHPNFGEDKNIKLDYRMVINKNVQKNSYTFSIYSRQTTSIKVILEIICFLSYCLQSVVKELNMADASFSVAFDSIFSSLS